VDPSWSLAFGEPMMGRLCARHSHWFCAVSPLRHAPLFRDRAPVRARYPLSQRRPARMRAFPALAVARRPVRCRPPTKPATITSHSGLRVTPRLRFQSTPRPIARTGFCRTQLSSRIRCRPSSNRPRHRRGYHAESMPDHSLGQWRSAKIPRSLNEGSHQHLVISAAAWAPC